MWEPEEEEEQPQRRAPQRKKFRKRPEPFEGEVADLTPEQVAKFQSRVRYTIVYHLQKGDKTRHELEEKLRKKVDIPAEFFAPALDEYEAKNFINDARYTEHFIHSRSEYRKQGKNVIRMELIRKGVASEIIDEALVDWDADEEAERAKDLVRVRMRTRSSQKMDRQKRTQNLVAMLARKGYPMGVAFNIVRELLDEEALELEAEESDIDLSDYEPYEDDA